MKIRFAQYLLIMITLIFLISCNNNPGVEFEKFEYDKIVGNCDQGICVDIHLRYYVLHEPGEIAKNFNPEMEEMVFGKMRMDSDSGNQDKDDFINSIISEYKAFIKEFPDAATGGYQQNTDCEISYESSKLISFYILTDNYSGGAHGMSWDEYLNIDPATGKKVEILDFLNDKNAFLNFVENELRTKLGMSPTDQWPEFTFLDEFTLPENIGMTTSGLRLVYNSYELLSYADGKTEILISNEKLKEFMELPLQ